MWRPLLAFLLFLTASAFAADLSGDYTGTYASDNGNSGKIQNTLTKKADSTWDCKFTFTYDGEEISTKTLSCVVTDGKVTSEYSADVAGTPIRTSFEGTAGDDKTLTGTYTTHGADGEVVDQGKWKASPRQ